MRAIAMALVGATMVFGDYAAEALGHRAADQDIINWIKLAWFLATLICIIGGW